MAEKPITTPIVVRRMAESDAEAADAVLRAAFARQASFLEHVRLTLALQPDGVFVAEEDGRLVGTVGAVDYGSLAYVGLMAVDPACQGRGIGRTLVTQLLRWLDERGCPLALLDATDKGAPLYQSLGFVDDHTASVFERDSALESTFTNHRDGQVRAAKNNELDEIAEFDARFFGADRRKLLAVLWSEHRERCLVVRDGARKLTGYLFARDAVLGPWVAESPAVAERMLLTAVSLIYEPDHLHPVVMVPRSNDRAADLLMRHGFSERRRLRHMRRGGSGPPGVPACLYGQSSFAHG